MGHTPELAPTPADIAQAPNGDSDQTRQKFAAARAGSSAAIGELFENCRNYLLLVANASVGEGLQAKVAASDLVQETFLEAHQILERFTGQTEEELLRGLTRILENKLGNAVKRYVWSAKREASREINLRGDGNSGENGPALADSGPSPSGLVAAEEVGATLHGAIRDLAEDHRRVIELRIHQSLPFDEVGRQMNRTSEAARKLFARAIDQLQARINRNGRAKP